MQYEILASLAAIVGEWLYDELSEGGAHFSQPHEGSGWIITLDGQYGSWAGNVVSCYYHPTKSHTATTIGKLGEKRSKAGPGEWAISEQPKGMYGNKCYYNTLDE